ncbi:hypothetical protein M0D69_07420 [Caballeronia sp. SEWSISQ10-4 2]|uniref:hypothetical protein n=1 Tax=Caballeronia sp. SEWSISQ10-4 2 TaxID=2937438 RepID=UPI002652E657|nr:hypothetical protein [Caballeronia sp. SEWSISQ10-4 2]MDN7177848.1 hypothetical protein [Caballeronia sp. SEWSISQ10-4 2]
MTSAQNSQREASAEVFAEFPRRQKIRPSRLLWGAMAAFVAIAAGSVFQCVSAYGGFFDAGVAASRRRGVGGDGRAGRCGLEWRAAPARRV